MAGGSDGVDKSEKSKMSKKNKSTFANNQQARAAKSHASSNRDVSNQTTEAEEAESPEKHPIEENLDVYLQDLQNLINTFQVGSRTIKMWLDSEIQRNEAVLQTYSKGVAENGSLSLRAESTSARADLLKAFRELEKINPTRTLETFAKSIFTQMFSDFDAFTGNLLKILYSNKTELFNTFKKEVSISELLKYKSIEDAKSDILEKEIDSFRRGSYIEQFTELENRFKIKTLKSFEEWSEFIELSQRRNLIVHNGSVINEYYIRACTEVGYTLPNSPQIGELLNTDEKYIRRAVILMSKVAFMLTHTLWRKIHPEQKDIEADSANLVAFNLMKDKRWKTAHEISEFLLTKPMIEGITDMSLKIRTINAAISAKFADKNEFCLKHLSSVDWSASIRDFKLAHAVLLEKDIEAAELMSQIGQKGELIHEMAYYEWPLFHLFRESNLFTETFEKIYGTSFIDYALERHKEEKEKMANLMIKIKKIT